MNGRANTKSIKNNGANTSDTSDTSGASAPNNGDNQKAIDDAVAAAKEVGKRNLSKS